MITDQAFVLHKRPYKDSSELIKLLTQNHGVLDVVAKGSLRPKSKLNGQLQLFTLTTINFIGRSSLKTLASAEQTNSYQFGPYLTHVCMLYCNELLLLCQPDTDAVSRLFSVYTNSLKAMKADQSVQLVLRHFEWQVCCAVGYQLSLPAGISGRDYITFDSQNGLVAETRLKKCMAASFENFTNNQKPGQSELKQVSWLMKLVVNHLVGGKEIHSRQLLLKKN